MNEAAKFNANTILNNRIDLRVSQWESNFDKNMPFLSEKISEGIAKEVFEALNKALSDPYAKLPSKARPLILNFSFEIVNSKSALKLQNLAQEAAELPPFKEWFGKFSIPNQKKEHDEDIFEGSSGLSVFKGETVSKRGIDHEYFQDMMALVGRAVDAKLHNTFFESNINSTLKVQATWYRETDKLISNPSSGLKNDSINVTAWIEENEKQRLETIHSTVANAIAFERNNRKKMEWCKAYQKIAVITVMFVVIVYMLTKIATEPQKKM